jgi:hypothetical protein
VIVHNAFLLAGSILRFNLNDIAELFLSDTDGALGFCAMINPSSGRDERILKPAIVSSEESD